MASGSDAHPNRTRSLQGAGTRRWIAARSPRQIRPLMGWALAAPPRLPLRNIVRAETHHPALSSPNRADHGHANAAPPCASACATQRDKGVKQDQRSWRRPAFLPPRTILLFRPGPGRVEGQQQRGSSKGEREATFIALPRGESVRGGGIRWRSPECQGPRRWTRSRRFSGKSKAAWRPSPPKPEPQRQACTMRSPDH